MTEPTYPSAKVRLLWDELLSHRVPRALRVLGINASHVGNVDDGAPPRGSTDRAVLEHARRTNQVIVTSNHDMMLLCASEASVSSCGATASRRSVARRLTPSNGQKRYRYRMRGWRFSTADRFTWCSATGLPSWV